MPFSRSSRIPPGTVLETLSPSMRDSSSQGVPTSALRDPEIVRFFDEHRKRSDTVLGLYNTLFVAGLKAAREQGALPPTEAALLDTLGL